MRFKKILLAAAAVSMAATPAVSVAQSSAAKLSVSKAAGVPASARAAAPKGKSKATSGVLILVLALIAVAGGVIAATSGDSSPDSP